MVSVPLNAMCSNMCARPVLPIGSCTEPASTWVKNENTGASGRSQMMMVRPFASFLTVVRFSKEARSCAKASAHKTKQATIVFTEMKRDFMKPPRRDAKNSTLRGGGEDCQTGDRVAGSKFDNRIQILRLALNDKVERMEESISTFNDGSRTLP